MVNKGTVKCKTESKGQVNYRKPQRTRMNRRLRKANGDLIRREQFGKCWTVHGRCPHVNNQGTCCANDPPLTEKLNKAVVVLLAGENHEKE